MPILIFQDDKGQNQERELTERTEITSIGSDPTINTIVLPASLDVAPRHAVVLRSAVNQLLVLVNLAGQQTRINGRHVISIKVLRQKDEIQLGQARLTMWEIRISALLEGSRYVNQTCQVCKRGMQVGDQVVICPHCSRPFHSLCWITQVNCGIYTCNYPVRERVLEALSPLVKFEVVGVDVLKKGKSCQAGERGDLIPFQPREQIAYCPSVSCQATYHMECWLKLESCVQPQCGFDIRQLMNSVFSTSKGTRLQTGRVYGG